MYLYKQVRIKPWATVAMPEPFYMGRMFYQVSYLASHVFYFYIWFALNLFLAQHKISLPEIKNACSCRNTLEKC